MILHVRPGSTLFPYTTLFRSSCSPTEAQLIVDSLVDRKIPLIWQRGNIIRVLQPSLGFPEKTLAVLYHLDPISPSEDRKSTRLNSSHTVISYAVFCCKKKKHD